MIMCIVAMDFLLDQLDRMQRVWNTKNITAFLQTMKQPQQLCFQDICMVNVPIVALNPLTTQASD